MQDGILQTRRHAALADVTAAKTLLDIARAARR